MDRKSEYENKIQEIQKKYSVLLNYMKTKDEFKKLYDCINKKRLAPDCLLKFEEALDATYSKLKKILSTKIGLEYKTSSPIEIDLTSSDDNNSNVEVLNNCVINKNNLQNDILDHTTEISFLNSSVENENNVLNIDPKEAVVLNSAAKNENYIESNNTILNEDNINEVGVKTPLNTKTTINLKSDSFTNNDPRVNPRFSQHKQSTQLVNTNYPFVDLNNKNQCSLYDKVKKDKMMLDCRIAHLKHGTVLDLVSDKIKKSLHPKKEINKNPLNKLSENVMKRSNLSHKKYPVHASNSSKNTILPLNENLPYYSDPSTSTRDHSQAPLSIPEYSSSSNEPKEHAEPHGALVSYNLYLSQSNDRLNSNHFNWNQGPQSYNPAQRNYPLGYESVNYCSSPEAAHANNYTLSTPLNRCNCRSMQCCNNNSNINMINYPNYYQHNGNKFYNNFSHHNQQPFNFIQNKPFRCGFHQTNFHSNKQCKRIKRNGIFNKFSPYKVNESAGRHTINSYVNTNNTAEQNNYCHLDNSPIKRKNSDGRHNALNCKSYLNLKKSNIHEKLDGDRNNLSQTLKESDHSMSCINGGDLDKNDIQKCIKSGIIVINSESDDSVTEIACHIVPPHHNEQYVGSAIKEKSPSANHSSDGRCIQIERKSGVRKSQSSDNIENTIDITGVNNLTSETKRPVRKVSTANCYLQQQETLDKNHEQANTIEINQCLETNKNNNKPNYIKSTSSCDLKQHNCTEKTCSGSDEAIPESTLIRQIQTFVTYVNRNPGVLKTVHDILSLFNNSKCMEHPSKDMQSLITPSNEEKVDKPPANVDSSTNAARNSIVENPILDKHLENNDELCNQNIGRSDYNIQVEEFSARDELEHEVSSMSDDSFINKNINKEIIDETQQQINENNTLFENNAKDVFEAKKREDKNKEQKQYNTTDQEMPEQKRRKLSEADKICPDLTKTPQQRYLRNRSVLRSEKIRDDSGTSLIRKNKIKSRRSSVNSIALSIQSKMKEGKRKKKGEHVSFNNLQTGCVSPSSPSPNNILVNHDSKNIVGNAGGVKIVEVFSIAERVDESPDDYKQIALDFLSSIDPLEDS